MKLTKKLIRAIGMLALSACMMVTSTFAWFSMNTSVTATGMTVSAKGDQVFLQIGNATETFADTAESYLSATGTVTTSGLLPAAVVAKVADFGTQGVQTISPYTGNTYSWVTAVSKNVNVSTAGSNYTNADSTNYYLLNEFKVRLDSTAGMATAAAPLKVSAITLKNKGTADGVTETTKDAMSNCVSVLVVGESVTNGETTTTYTQLWKQDTQNVWYEVAKETNGKLTATNFAYTDAAPLTVKVYVFFDGENGNCTITNLKASANNYSVDVAFTVSAD